MTNEQLINKKLVEYYGSELDGRPRYRLSWSDDELEIRNGVHREFYGKIFLREWIGPKKVKKYPYIQSRWVLEKLAFFPIKELPESSTGHYEPVWAFYGPNLTYQRPELKYVLYIIQTLQNGTKRDKAYWDEVERQQDLEELQHYEDVLGFDYVPTMLRNKEGIVVPEAFGG